VPEQRSWQGVFLVRVIYFSSSPYFISLLPNSTFQILFYALRPGFVRTQRLTFWHITGIIVQVSFNFLLATFVSGGQNMLTYLIMSSFWAGSLHPMAGHFIAEHYVWDGLQQETYSYYGWLNIFGYNVSHCRLVVPMKLE
jgi:sphingolipid 4-desaturase/C4-monooxygenase